MIKHCADGRRRHIIHVPQHSDSVIVLSRKEVKNEILFRQIFFFILIDFHIVYAIRYIISSPGPHIKNVKCTKCDALF